MDRKFPEKVTICEVVTRDGFQTAPEIYPVEEKVRIVEEVVDAGYRCVEVGAFSTYETMYKMKDTDKVFEKLHMKEGVEYRGLVYEKLEDIYNEGGYELLGMADQGFRVMTTNVAVNDLSDFAGQKIRTMENSFHLAFWQALDANPTPMAFSEVYIGLQQKTIDAEENPVEVIVSGRLYEQQDYVVETNHLPHYISLFMNADLFHELDSEYQEILVTAAQTATEYAREQADERVEDRMAVIEESGTEVIKLSDELVLLSLGAMFMSPVASSSYNMAEAMGGDGNFAGTVVVATSVLSVVTIFLWVFLLSSFGMI